MYSLANLIVNNLNQLVTLILTMHGYFCPQPEWG